MLDHLADLASDFSAIHGIDDIMALPCPVFFALACRITAYESVMRHRVNAELAAQPDTAGAAEPDARGDATAADPGVVVGTRLAIEANSLLSSVISFGGPPRGETAGVADSRAGKSPLDPENASLLTICPICGGEDPGSLIPGTADCGSWMCWPAHAWCIAEVTAT